MTHETRHTYTPGQGSCTLGDCECARVTHTDLTERIDAAPCVWHPTEPMPCERCAENDYVTARERRHGTQ